MCISNLKEALINASKGKLDYFEVKEALKDSERVVEEIHRMLLNKTFKCSKYKTFIKVTKSKEREIFKLPFFPDRIIQHAIMQVLEPIWKKSLIKNTYQAIRGRGVHLCLRDVKRVIDQGETYCLQIDIKKFYPSINNEILKSVVRKKLKCKDTLSLLDTIIDNSSGVPIGNYISQYFGNIFLSDIDRHIKERLKVKSYFRYCDDLILLHDSKKFLWECFHSIKKELGFISLEVKDNYRVYKVNTRGGVNCLGFNVFTDRVSIRKSIIRSYRDRVNKMKLEGSVDRKVLGSYFGWWKHSTYYEQWRSLTLPLLSISDDYDRVFILKLNKLLRGVKHV